MGSEIKSQNREQLHYNYNSVNVTSAEESPTSFREHWHLSAEFILAIKDDCIYTIGKDTYHLMCGDLLLVWPAELHSTVNTPESATILLQFSSSIIDSSADLSTCLPFMQTKHLIRANDPEGLNAPITDLIMDSVRIYHQQDSFLETEIKINIYKILMLLARHERSIQQTSPDANLSGGATYSKIKAACSYISMNCDRDLTQTEVADYAGFSHYYFSRLFKQYTFLSFSDYLTRQRIRRAIELLSSGNIAITDVAYQSGFQSISNFNRAFKLSMNCSPRQFQNMYNSRRSERDGYPME